MAEPRLLFPMLAHDETYQTGVALLNPNPEPAAVTVEVWGPGGTRDRSTSLVLPANGSTSFYLDNHFPTLEPRLVGNLRVRSDQPLTRVRAHQRPQLDAYGGGTGNSSYR